MWIQTSGVAALTFLPALLQPVAAPSVQEEPLDAPLELPMSEWIDGLEDLGDFHVRYRVVNRKGEVHNLTIQLRGTGFAHIEFRAEASDECLHYWVRDGVMSNYYVDDESVGRTFAIDFAAQTEAAYAWLDEALAAADLAPFLTPSVKTLCALWPAEEDDATWNLHVTGALTGLPSFGWLARLRDCEYTVTREGEDWRASLVTGEEIVLHAETGAILSFAIDRDDPDQGRVECVGIDTDGALEDSVFVPEIPSSAVVVDGATMEAQWRDETFVAARREWFRAALGAFEADADFLTKREDALGASAARFYVARFAQPIAGTVAEWKEQLDGDIERMLPVWESSREQPGAREALEAAWERLQGAVTQACTRRAEGLSGQFVVAPYPSENGAMDALLAIEKRAAAKGLAAAFVGPIEEYLAERWEEFGEDGGDSAARSGD